MIVRPGLSSLETFVTVVLARWKCAQNSRCVDLILGFLQLVGDSPGKKKLGKLWAAQPQPGLSWSKLQPGAKTPKLGNFADKWVLISTHLLVLFYDLLPIPEVPIHSVWTVSVGDVVRFFLYKIQKYFSKKTPRNPIKLDEPFFEGQ